MKRLIVVEFKNMLKNKITIIVMFLMCLNALIENYHVMTNIFIDECDYVINISEEFGIPVSEIIESSYGEDLYNYVVCLDVKTCIALPIFMYSKKILIFAIPLLCFFVNNDFESGILKQKSVYYDKYVCCIAKSIAFSLVIGLEFLLIAFALALQSIINKKIFLKEDYCQIYEAISDGIGNYYLIFFIAVLIIMIFVAVFSVLSYSLSYTSLIRYSGIVISVFGVLKNPIKFFYFPKNVMAFLLYNVFGRKYMGNYSIGPFQVQKANEIYLSYFLWVVFCVIISYILLKNRKQYIL